MECLLSGRLGGAFKGPLLAGRRLTQFQIPDAHHRCLRVESGPIQMSDLLSLLDQEIPQCIQAFHGAVAVRPPDWLRTQWPWTVRFGADRCKSLRHFPMLERSSRGTIGSKRFQPLRKPAYSSGWGMLVAMRAALSPSVADPHMQQRGRSHTAGTASGPLACLYGRCQAESMALTTLIGNFSEATSRRRSALENGTIGVLLVGIRPLPHLFSRRPPLAADCSPARIEL